MIQGLVEQVINKLTRYSQLIDGTLLLLCLCFFLASKNTNSLMIYQRNQFTDSSFIIRLRCLWVLLLLSIKQCCKNHSNSTVWNWCTTNMRTPYHLTWQGKHLPVPNLQSGMCQGFQIWKEWRATSDNLAGKTFLWQRRDGRLPSCAHAQQKKTCHGPTHAAHVLGKNTVPSVTSWLGLIYQTDNLHQREKLFTIHTVMKTSSSGWFGNHDIEWLHCLQYPQESAAQCRSQLWRQSPPKSSNSNNVLHLQPVPGLILYKKNCCL